MTAAARVGVAGIGLASPLGDTPEGAWERLLAGHGGVGRMSFDGLPPAAGKT